MSRVFVDADTAQWVHADTGNQIGTWEVRNQEPHRSAIEKRAGKSTVHMGYSERIAGPGTAPGTVDDYGDSDAPVPPENFMKAEEEYVDEILRSGNYA